MVRWIALSVAGSLALACGASGPSNLALSACQPAECGPPMMAPNYLCTDGTIGGPGPCVLMADGRCGWSFRTCKPVTPCTGCALAGVQPMTCVPPFIGASGPSGICVVQPDGSCAELQLHCYLP